MAAAVWEWKNDQNIWLPYSAVVSKFLDSIQRKKLTIAQLGDIDPALSKYTVNLSNFSEESDDLGVTKPIRRTVYTDNDIIKGVSWQWSDSKSETWHFYQIEVQIHIETSYQKHKNVELNLQEKFPHLAFILNFQANTQTSKVTGYTRSIRRIEENVYPRVKKRITRSSSTFPAGNSQSEVKISRKSRSSLLRSNSETKSESNMFTSIPGPSTQAIGKHQLQQSPSNASRKKRSNAGENEEKSLLKTLTSSARLIANLFTSKNNSRRKSKRKSVSPYVPFPTLSGDVCEKPVIGVKAPNEICLINATDVKPIDVFELYTVTSKALPGDDDCSICCCSLKDSSYFEDRSNDVIELKSCSHKFHKSCVSAMYNSSNKVGFLQCPTCKLIYGIKVGNQPAGHIHYTIIPNSIPSYDCETIVITYMIPHGIQGPEHPHPGLPYTARGFPRRCYLPDNDEGRKVMKLLVTAWERRLIFTIGQSSTTGENGTVTWNEIHHKTEFGSNWSGHGYPDPLYLQNVLQELALQGVTDELIIE